MAGLEHQSTNSNEIRPQIADLSSNSLSDIPLLPLAESNFSTFITLHTIFGGGRCKLPATVESSDPLFAEVRQDLEQLLERQPDLVAQSGMLTQEDNRTVNRLTCSLALLCCKVDLDQEMQYGRNLMRLLLGHRGHRLRAKVDGELDLGTAFDPDYLNLYRAASVKFTDQSIAQLFRVLRGESKASLYTDPELLRLMTITCDCYKAKEASLLLSGLLTAHSKNKAAFAKLGEQQTIPAIIRKFDKDNVASVIKDTTIFIIRTALKNHADQLLQDLVNALEPEEFQKVTKTLGLALRRMREVHPVLIASLLKAHRSSDGFKSAFKLLETLKQISPKPGEFVSYDAQGLIVTLYNQGVTTDKLLPFGQQIRKLNISSKLYDQTIDKIGVLQRFLKDPDRKPGQHVFEQIAELPSNSRILPLLQLGMLRYQVDTVHYLGKLLTLLTANDYPPASRKLVVDFATSELPTSLDRLAKPEDFMGEGLPNALAPALTTLFIRAETAEIIREDEHSAADIIRKFGFTDRKHSPNKQSE